jgi:hypothetical protein
VWIGLLDDVRSGVESCGSGCPDFPSDFPSVAALRPRAVHGAVQIHLGVISSGRASLSAGGTEARLAVIRQRTHTGRPLGAGEFIQDLEKATQHVQAFFDGAPAWSADSSLTPFVKML